MTQLAQTSGLRVERAAQAKPFHSREEEKPIIAIIFDARLKPVCVELSADIMFTLTREF